MCPCFSRSIYNAAVWYYHHCQDRMPIVMVTEDEEAIQQYGSETEGVFVISFKVPASGVSVSVSVCVHFFSGAHNALDPEEGCSSSPEERASNALEAEEGKQRVKEDSSQRVPCLCLSPTMESWL